MVDVGMAIPNVEHFWGNAPTTHSKNVLFAIKKINISNMKVHVGKHILGDECQDSKLCGYYGGGACSNRLAEPTKRCGKKFYFKVLSNCPYYVDIKKAKKKYVTEFTMYKLP